MKKVSYQYNKQRGAYSVSYRFPKEEDYLLYQKGEIDKLVYPLNKKRWVKGEKNNSKVLRKVLSIVEDIEKQLYEIEKKVWLSDEITKAKSPKQLEYTIIAFINSLNIRPKTVSYYKDATNNFLKFLAAEYPKIKLISQLKENHLKNFLSYGREKGWSVKFIYEQAAFLKRFTREYCLEEKEYIATDPFRKVKPERVNKFINRRHSLSTKDLEIYISIFEKELEGKYKYYAHIALMLPFCGLRRKEIINLTWSNVKEYKKQIYLAPVASKTDQGVVRPAVLRKQGVVYLPEKPQSAAADDYIFPEQCRNSDGHNVYKFIKRRLIKYGLGEHCLHSLRHTYGTNLIKDGMPVPFVKEAMGHRSISTTEIYLHTKAADVASAMKKIEE